MNQQQKNKQKTVPEFPEKLKKQTEDFLGAPLEKVEYKSTFSKFENNKNYRIDVFVINDKWVVQSYDNGEFYTYGTLEKYKEKNKLFGERVRTLIEETGVPWELGRLVVSHCTCGTNYLYHVAINDCKDFLDAKEEVKASILRTCAYKENKFVAILYILRDYELNSRYNLKDKSTFSTLRKFLFES